MTNSPSGSRRAVVAIATRPFWRLRLAREMPRYLLCAASLAGLAASARFTLAPPRAAGRPVRPSGPAPADRAAEGYAALFARRYLTWSSAEPQASTRALEPFVGPGMEPGIGLVPPQSGEQHVGWLEVVQAREPATGQHVYTIAAQTDSSGLLYLTVGVARTAEGRLALTGYPAFVGPPASGPALSAARSQEVADPALQTVVTRALRNYLSGASGELAADLSGSARVSVPAVELTMESIERLDWSPDGRSVIALAQAQDARGTHYTLEYELDVDRAQGRWEVSAVQMDPYS